MFKKPLTSIKPITFSTLEDTKEQQIVDNLGTNGFISATTFNKDGQINLHDQEPQQQWNIDPILINQNKKSQKSISNPVILDPRLQDPLTKIPEATPVEDQAITTFLGEEDNSVEAQFTTDQMEHTNQESPTPMEPSAKELGLESILMNEEQASEKEISNSLQDYSPKTTNHFSQKFLSHPSRNKHYLSTPIGVG